MENKDFDFSRFKNALIYSTQPEFAVRKSWETNFTSPAKHNDRKFCYVVHGLKDMGGRIHQRLFMARERVYDTSQDIDLLQYPERVSDKKVISTSIVDQDHRATWGNVGLILNVPYNNVIAAYREDVGTPFFDANRVKKEKVPAVGDITESTHPSKYNEIVLVGSTIGSKVSVAGFWAKVYEDGQPIDKALYQQTQQLAKIRGLPFVKIVEKIETYKDSPVEILRGIIDKRPTAIVINRDGIRYVLDLKESRFTIYDKKRQARDMTREDFKLVYGLAQKELSPEQQKSIRADISQLHARFAEWEYRKTNPLPEVFTEIKSKKPYAFALNREGRRYLIDFSKKSFTVIVKEKLKHPKPKMHILDTFGTHEQEDYDFKQTSMTKKDFELAKRELLKDLKGKDLELFNKLLPSFEEHFH